MNRQFEDKLKVWRFYAKQYWKVKNQDMLIDAEVNYEAATCRDCDGGYTEEHWSHVYAVKFSRLMKFCERHTTAEMIEISRPLNHGGVRDIVDLIFPPEVYTDVIKPY